jgi:hypothetical protein
VLLGDGTLARGLRDAVLVARAPGETEGWRLLAEGLELPDQLVQRGPWVCFTEMPGEERAVHCVNPARGAHVASQRLPGNVNLFDIELTPAPRVIFRQLTPDRTLAMPL